MLDGADNAEKTTVSRSQQVRPDCSESRHVLMIRQQTAARKLFNRAADTGQLRTLQQSEGLAEQGRASGHLSIEV